LTIKVANGHWLDENQVSKTSLSFSQPSPGHSLWIFISPSLYQAGIGIPQYICLDIFQSFNSFIQ